VVEFSISPDGAGQFSNGNIVKCPLAGWYAEFLAVYKLWYAGQFYIFPIIVMKWRQAARRRGWENIPGAPCCRRPVRQAARRAVHKVGKDLAA
jgi:hypothetical protein